MFVQHICAVGICHTRLGFVRACKQQGHPSITGRYFRCQNDVVTQEACRGAGESLPDASSVWPVSGHKGTCQQWRDRLVKQEVVLQEGAVEVKVEGC